jgi:hypothetical protein
MLTQLRPDELQRVHEYVSDIGVNPLQVPGLA